jgi:hypothetical protein
MSRNRIHIPDLLEDAENTLSSYFRELLRELYDEIVHFDERIETNPCAVDEILTERV